MKKISSISLIVATYLLSSASTMACSVCFHAREETRVAFYITTALLSLLPLAMIGGVVFWLRKRILEVQKAELVKS